MLYGYSSLLQHTCPNPTKDDEDEGNWVEDMLFDLGILEEQVPLPPAAIAEERADRNVDNNVEEPQQEGAILVIDPAVVDAGDEEQRGEAENLARFPVFHRLVCIRQCLYSFH